MLGFSLESSEPQLGPEHGDDAVSELEAIEDHDVPRASQGAARPATSGKSR